MDTLETFAPALRMPGTATITPVVLSGGTGTRLWPLSRESFPKQFWPLTSDRTMLEETAARAAGEDFAPAIVVCNASQRFLVAEQMQCFAGTTLLLEPVGRNSAPAIAAAALIAAEQDPDSLLWLLAADHAVADTALLHAALGAAALAARQGCIVAFGVAPSTPETGYGYIEPGASVPGAPGVSRIERFVEKPDLRTAQRYLDEGRHLWNSGMFVATAATLLDEFARLEPALLAQARAAVAEARREAGCIHLAPCFAVCPSVSVDYAVMERTDRAAVVPLPSAIGWSDIGSWDALWQASDKDAANNVVAGPVEVIDSTGCYVRSEGMLAGVIGLRDIVLVVTDDAVLAMPRSRGQDVKALVERLKAARRPEATEHRRMYRPWGHYEGVIRGERFQVKKIQVRPGGRLSLQKHFHRAEHWVVVNGTAIVHCDGTDLLLRENESVYLPLGCVHRLENPGQISLNLIEVQTGAYLGEDDIVRLEDTYGRS